MPFVFAPVVSILSAFALVGFALFFPLLLSCVEFVGVVATVQRLITTTELLLLAGWQMGLVESVGVRFGFIFYFFCLRLFVDVSYDASTINFGVLVDDDVFLPEKKCRCIYAARKKATSVL